MYNNSDKKTMPLAKKKTRKTGSKKPVAQKGKMAKKAMAMRKMK
jgi:hypothetical protein